MSDTKHRCGTVALLCVGFVVASCSSERKAPESAAVESQATQADEAAIKGVHLRVTRAIKEKDAGSLLALFDSDLVVMPPNEPPIVGKAALRSWFLRLTDQFSIELDSSVEELKVSGDWAFERFSFRQTMTPTGGGEPATARGKGIHVFRRQSDGSWKIARDIWNSDEAAGVGDQLDGGGAPGDRSTRARGAGAARRGGWSGDSSQDELAGSLRAELAEARRQLRDSEAQGSRGSSQGELERLRRQIAQLRERQAGPGPGDPSQAELIKRLQAQLAEQKGQIGQMQASTSCPECPVAIQRKGVIYLWDGRPPEPVEIPIEWVRR